MNKKTKALTTEQYKEIIQTMREGFCGCRPNERIATALVLEGNLGLRISDILKLRLCDVVRDGDRYRLEVVEQKTGKRRIFTVPLVIQQYMENYCLRCGIRRNELIFPITERAVQKQLRIVCDYFMRASVPIASANGMLRRFIMPMALILRWFNGCCNIAAQAPHSGISVLSHSASNRRYRITHNSYDIAKQGAEAPCFWR